MGIQQTFYEAMREHGITRRSFLKFCSLTAAGLGLGPEFAGTIAHALETKPRTPVIWLHGLECTCCSESFIRSGHPLAADVILSMISLDYDDTLMAAAGYQAEEILEQTIAKYDGNFILACEGNPPLNEDGMYCIQGGQALRGKTAPHGESLQGHHCLGFLCLLGLRAGREPESDARHAHPQGHHRQADHQGSGLSAHRGSHDRRHHLYADLRSASRNSTAREGRRCSTASAFTTSATGGRISTPASSSSASTTKARARAIVCTRWAARDRPRTTPARRWSGTAVCPGRSSPGTAAWVAPKTISGTADPSTVR